MEIQSKFYGVYATEASYSGLHGVEGFDVFWCSLDEAHRIGRAMSIELMESYGLLPINCSDEEFNDYVNESVLYQIYELRDDCNLSELKSCSNPSDFLHLCATQLL